MHVSMHNWMRAEPIEVTIARLAKCGYDAIEISGEPERYDTKDVGKLLKDHGLDLLGLVTLMLGERDLLAKDEAQRAMSVKYVQGHHHDGEGARRRGDHDRARRTVGKIMPQALARGGVEVGGREPASSATSTARRKACGSRIEPLNRFETYFLNRHDQALLLAEAVGPECGVCLDVFHMNIEEKDMCQAIRNAKGRAERLPRRRQQPHGLRHGRARLEEDHRHAQGDRLRRRADGRVRRAASTARRPTRTRTCSSRATSS